MSLKSQGIIKEDIEREDKKKDKTNNIKNKEEAYFVVQIIYLYSLIKLIQLLKYLLILSLFSKINEIQLNIVIDTY